MKIVTRFCQKKLVVVATSLMVSGKEGQRYNLRSNIYHLLKKSLKSVQWILRQLVSKKSLKRKKIRKNVSILLKSDSLCGQCVSGPRVAWEAWLSQYAQASIQAENERSEFSACSLIK